MPEYATQATKEKAMTTDQPETETTIVVTQPVKIASFLMPAGGVASYMAGLMAQADEQAATVQDGVQEALRGVEAAENAGEAGLARSWRLRLARRRRERDRIDRFCRALREGYVPLPRMPAISLEHAQQLVPPEVLDSLAEAKKAGLFDEFRIVDGRNAWDSGYPRSWSRPKTRDPILVGRIGKEIFAVGWWRPTGTLAL
jgi:hypothetical protein